VERPLSGLLYTSTTEENARPAVTSHYHEFWKCS